MTTCMSLTRLMQMSRRRRTPLPLSKSSTRKCDWIGFVVLELTANGLDVDDRFYFMKTLPKYEDIVEGKRPISLPEKSRNAPKICLVLDLDETLVHCSVDEVKNPHMQFPVCSGLVLCTGCHLIADSLCCF